LLLAYARLMQPLLRSSARRLRYDQACPTVESHVTRHLYFDPQELYLHLALLCISIMLSIRTACNAQWQQRRIHHMKVLRRRPMLDLVRCCALHSEVNRRQHFANYTLQADARHRENHHHITNCALHSDATHRQHNASSSTASREDLQHTTAAQEALLEESRRAVLLSELRQRHGPRIGAVALGCALSYLDLSSLAGLQLPLEPIGAITTLLGAAPAVQQALRDVRNGKVTLNVSMSVGILAALGTGETLTSSLMTLVILISEVLEELCVDTAHSRVDSVLSSLPSTATRISSDGSSQRVPLADIRIDDTVRVGAGAMVPVDGTVVQGSAYVDEATITGESLPVAKAAGAEVRRLTEHRTSIP
jgi:cation transport ATPase